MQGLKTLALYDGQRPPLHIACTILLCLRSEGVWSYGVWSYDLPVVAKLMKIRWLADGREAEAPCRLILVDVFGLIGLIGQIRQRGINVLEVDARVKTLASCAVGS